MFGYGVYEMIGWCILCVYLLCDFVLVMFM